MSRLPRFVLTTQFVLPLGCLVALAWANLDPETYYRVAHALDFSVNDVAIALFFGVMTALVVDETLAGGVLHSWRRATVPVLAAVGGILVPFAIYRGLLELIGEPMLKEAWVTTCGVDVAMAFLAGRLIFGRGPAVPFLVLLSIASNAIGLAAIALLNPTSLQHAAIGLAIVLVAMAVSLLLRRTGVKTFWAYLIVPGVLSWYGLYFSGVHPSLALVAVVPFMPHTRRDPGLLADPLPSDHSTLSMFERFAGPPVQLILFLFGLVNAGVPLHGIEAGMWALPVAVLVGRPIGVLVATEAAIAIGFHRTATLGWRAWLVIGVLASAGVTMALFFAGTIFSIGPLLSETRGGALITVVGVAAGWLLARLLGLPFVGTPATPDAKN